MCSLFLIVNIEASVTRLDCNHGLCPQTQGAVTCTITGSVALWYSPPSGRSVIATVSSENIYNGPNTGFTGALVTINNQFKYYFKVCYVHFSYSYHS